MAKSSLLGAISLALILCSASASGAAIYPVDDDRDGRADRVLELEQSDSLA